MGSLQGPRTGSWEPSNRGCSRMWDGGGECEIERVNQGKAVKQRTLSITEGQRKVFALTLGKQIGGLNRERTTGPFTEDPRRRTLHLGGEEKGA